MIIYFQLDNFIDKGVTEVCPALPPTLGSSPGVVVGVGVEGEQRHGLITASYLLAAKHHVVGGGVH